MNPADETMDELAAELRALYRRLEPSPSADELIGAAPETARVVHWMQGVWNTLEAPPARVPRAIPLRRSERRFVRRTLLAAAAVLLLLAGAALWHALATRVEPARIPRVAQAPPPAPASGVEVLDVRPDQVELRSGPVRLVLLDPPPPKTSSEPPGS